MRAWTIRVIDPLIRTAQVGKLVAKGIAVVANSPLRRVLAASDETVTTEAVEMAVADLVGAASTALTMVLVGTSKAERLNLLSSCVTKAFAEAQSSEQ